MTFPELQDFSSFPERRVPFVFTDSFSVFSLPFALYTVSELSTGLLKDRKRSVFVNLEIVPDNYYLARYDSEYGSIVI